MKFKPDKRCNFCRRKVTEGCYIKATRKDICICDDCIEASMIIITDNKPR